jgi:peptidoglycan/LPS O-acetylase OafA/YrhL
MNRLSNIQILRACAALMIVIYHCGIETGRLAASSGHDRLFDETPWGLGVPLFFSISGFIMVVTTADMSGSPTVALDFMRRRLIRIVPLYWAVTTVSLLAALILPSLMSKVPPGDNFYVVASYLFWPAMRLGGEIRPLATPGWTLNLEMLFYVLFAVALLLPRRQGMALIFAWLALLVTVRINGWLPGVALNFWGDPIVLGFLSGAAIGILYSRGLRLPKPWAAICLVLGVAALFQHWPPDTAEDGLLKRLADGAPAAFLLTAFALGPQIKGRGRLWFAALLIGDASYSLYLLQEFLLRLLSMAWVKTAAGSFAPLWAYLPIGVIISLIACVVTYRSFEQPVTRWLNSVRWRRNFDPLGGAGPRPLAANNVA